MCGIAGAVSMSAKADPTLVEAMTACLAHRGPDGAGYATSADGRAAFGFRRLAIVDLDTGDQPVYNEDRSVISMLNGEIYNHLDLRAELIARGHTFVTDHADSEVIPHGYEEWGDSVLDRLRGMFGVAVWDARRERLLLARDRLGEKPLYFRSDDGLLRFASELQPLLAAAETIDQEALALYLTYQYIPAPWTIVASVRKLGPGEAAVWDHSGLATRRYWTLPTRIAATTGSLVMDLIRESVRDRMQGDVPIGAFLSGGVDSSVVTALMAQGSSTPVHTFSIGFSEPRLDETAAAENVARAIGTNHHVLQTNELTRDVAEGAVRSLGEPLADAAAVPTYILSKYASQWVKVVLTGEGADELFGGYARYRYQHRLRPLLTAPIAFRRLAAAILRSTDNVGGRLPGRLPDLLEAPIDQQPREWRSVMPRAIRRSVAPGAGWGFEDPVLGAARSNSNGSAVQGSFATDLATWVPDDLLVKVDRTTMAFGLEARPPFLDHELVEAVLGLPLAERWRPDRDKPLLRDLARSLLPAATAARPKQTFTTPAAAWLRGPLRESNREALTALFDSGLSRTSVDVIVQRSLEGGRDAGQWAWTMYVLGRWLVDHPSARMS